MNDTSRASVSSEPNATRTYKRSKVGNKAAVVSRKDSVGSFIDEMHNAKVNSTLTKCLELLHDDGVDPTSDLWTFAMMRFEKQIARELWMGIDPPEQRVK